MSNENQLPRWAFLTVVMAPFVGFLLGVILYFVYRNQNTEKSQKALRYAFAGFVAHIATVIVAICAKCILK